MATRLFTRSFVTSKQTLTSVISSSYPSLRLSTPPSSLSAFSVFRLRPLVAVAGHFHRLSPAGNSIRGFATRQTSSSLNDPNPNWSNRPPKETILLDGCDFEHWLVVLEKPEGDPTRDEIIDSYIKTLAEVVGSEEEARMKIYSVSTKHYYAFGALVSEELSYKLKEIPRVRWVLPDSYLDVRNKDYGGEPFINGEAVPYDPKYHEEWVRNNSRAQDRNRRNDRPRNFDRSRNFEKRRENIQNRGVQNPGSNMGGPPQQPGSTTNMRGQPPMNMGHPTNVGAPPPGYMGSQTNMEGAPNNRVGVPNMRNMPQNNMRVPQNMGPGHNIGGMGGDPGHNMSGMGGGPGHNIGGMGGGPGHNMGGMGGGPGHNMGGDPGHNMGGMGGGPGHNMGGGPGHNMGGMGSGPGSNMGGMGGGPSSNMGGMPTNNMAGNASNFQYSNRHNSGGMHFQNRDMSGQGQNRDYQHGYDAPHATGENPYQNQNISGRDIPPSPGYQ